MRSFPENNIGNTTHILPVIENRTHVQYSFSQYRSWALWEETIDVPFFCYEFCENISYVYDYDFGSIQESLDDV